MIQVIVRDLDFPNPELDEVRIPVYSISLVYIWRQILKNQPRFTPSESDGLVNLFH